MKVSQNDLARYIVMQLNAGKNVEKLGKDVAEYLVAQRRSRELTAIMRKVAKIREAEQGIIEATVTSSYPLSSTIINNIKSLLGTPAKVVITQAIDPAVIGGVRIEGSDKGIDLTVERQLKQLKQLAGAN